MSPQIVCFGECMIELSGRNHSQMRLSYGGDTLNTAVYLARSGLATDYVTALGDDPYSDWMIEQWHDEGVGTRHVIRAPGRMPGLYAIRTDGAGERQFHYWRDQAAIRDFFTFEGSDAIFGRIAKADLLYLSGITLSLFYQHHFETLIDHLTTVREQGCRIAFDTNYRPRGWPDAATARRAMSRIFAITDIALPTLEDDRQVFGDKDAAACAERLHEAGVTEVAVKLGPDGCLSSTAGSVSHVDADHRPSPVDTTGAGDSFNAAYLAARLTGDDPIEATKQGHRLAGEVIMHPGAIIPNSAMPHEPEPGNDA